MDKQWLAHKVRNPIGYFGLADKVTILVDSLVPTALTPVMMTRAMSAAINRYSITVAPENKLATDRHRDSFADTIMNSIPWQLKTCERTCLIVHFHFAHPEFPRTLMGIVFCL